MRTAALCRGLPVSRRLAACPIGVVPILWNNVDQPDLSPTVPAEVVLDDAARLRFDGVQSGRGFPAGAALAAALGDRGLRLAEVYAELPCTPDGPTDDALAIGRTRLASLDDAGGEVLVAACGVGGGRSEWAGRGGRPEAPSLTDPGWRRLADLLDALAGEAEAVGRRLAFHPHAGTFVETPAEVDRLLETTVPDRVGLCLDVGHYLVGGGDPVAAIGRYGRRVRHVHLKDVDGTVLERLRRAELADFDAAIRARLFTELGNGLLDLAGVIEALEGLDYGGWLMVEQDSSWLAPAQAAAVGRRVLDFALRRGTA